ncbi:MAG: hypothetical protein PF517_04365 [Salinivirgaceae bacterium]|jgi:hypothetical protein|nr:hypothetical protein [Salinivirgaceae bacterium]
MYKFQNLLITNLLVVLVISTNIQAQLVQPKLASNKYTLKFANIYFEISPEIGARISSCKIEGNELMYVDNSSNYWGSTFWLSPQSVWEWPPSKELDIEAYNAGISDNKIWLGSKTDPKTKMSFSKTVYANTADTSITIEYALINNDTLTQKFAPWEITRVPTEGLTFFPNADQPDTFIWIDINKPSKKKEKKFYDSKGWLAYANNSHNILIKLFEDISPVNTAPKETEIEIYRWNGPYVELENQGNYKSIPAGDSVVWTVKWYVRSLPKHFEIKEGSEDLIYFSKKFVEAQRKTQN